MVELDLRAHEEFLGPEVQSAQMNESDHSGRPLDRGDDVISLPRCRAFSDQKALHLDRDDDRYQPEENADRQGDYAVADRCIEDYGYRQRAEGENEAEESAQVLEAYEQALNASSVDAVMELYAEDGVFMAQHRDPAVGADAVRQAYKKVFSAIDLDIEFEIDEVEVLSPTIAYARTRSTGSTKILATGARVSEANQELFVMVRVDEDAPWQIGRYIFSTTTPPPSAGKTHVPVLEEVKANAIPIDPAVGVATIALEGGTYVVTDGIWQSAFVVTNRGVIVVDAPESFGTKLRDAIAAVTDQPIRVLVYSHAHKDHIGGSATFAGIPGLKIVALESVRRFLDEKQDPKRLAPNTVFSKAKTIRSEEHTSELQSH